MPVPLRAARPPSAPSPRRSPSAPTPEPLLDVAALAGWLGLTAKGVYNLVEAGQAPPSIRIGRRLRWRREDVEGWLEAQRTEAEA
jgi:excisionase family DNA binding protein